MTTATPKRTRNRARKPTWRYAQFSIADWQADLANVTWAQGAAQFRDLLSIAVTDKAVVLSALGTATENCLLGREQGYAALLDHIRKLADGADSPPEPPEAPSYPAPQANATPADWSDT